MNLYSIMKFVSSNLPMIGVILLLGMFFYGFTKINTLETKVDLKEVEIQQLHTRYNELEVNYEKLYTDYELFVQRIKTDLSTQRAVQERISEENAFQKRRLSELQNTFTTSADNTPRDIEEIMDRKGSLLEKRINDATRRIGNEIEETTTD